MISFQPDSSMINRADYDEATQRLVVTFNNGARYRYDNIDPDIFAAFRESPSKGRYFSQVIKPIRIGHKLP